MNWRISKGWDLVRLYKGAAGRDGLMRDWRRGTETVGKIMNRRAGI